MKKTIAKLILILMLLNLEKIQITGAYLTDEETSGNNVIRAGVWNVAPVIAGVSHWLATPKTANELQTEVSWITDRPATGNVDWKTAAGDPWTAVEPKDTTADKTNQMVTITGLLPLTTYYYRVRSTNQYGRETISDKKTFVTGQFRFDNFFAKSDIVINEFLPNPAGDDAAAMPEGEWIELFNRSYTNSYDLTGWYLTDRESRHRLPITIVNVDSHNIVIGPQNFLVVYRNGDKDFSLNNDAHGDQVNLYDETGNLMDQYEYNSGLGDTVLENKSFCRYPDGSDTWFDPPPTPGKHNRLTKF